MGLKYAMEGCIKDSFKIKRGFTDHSASGRSVTVVMMADDSIQDQRIKK